MSDVTVNNAPTLCSQVVSYAAPTVTSLAFTAPTTSVPLAYSLSYTFTGATTGIGSGTGSGSTFNGGVTNVTVTATNACGSASTTFNVTVNDNEAPVIVTEAQDETVECDGSGNLADFNDWLITNWGNADARDNCTDTTRLNTYWVNDYDVSNWVADCGMSKHVYVGFRVYDASHNYSAWTYATFRIVDTTPPSISSIPGPVTVSCASDVPAFNDGAVVYSDICGGAVRVTHADVITNQSCANRYTVTRTYTVTDACGNSSSANQIITVDDEIAPTLVHIPADFTVDCSGDIPVNIYNVVVSEVYTGGNNVFVFDNCSGALTVTSQDVVNPGGCVNHFTVSRIWTVTDVCGNHSSQTQTITVNDQTAPELSGCPGNMVLSSCAPDPTWNITATDNCPLGAVTITHTAFPSHFANGTTTNITYTATDACGNASSCSFTVTRKPLLTATLASPIRSCGYNISCNGAHDGSVTSSVSGGQSSYTYLWSPGGQTTPGLSGQGAGTYTVTITDQDGCSMTRTITLTQPAVLTCNAGADENTYFGFTADQSFTHTATVAGGCGPYNYSWTFTRMTMISNVLTPLPASTGGLRCNNVTSTGDEIFSVTGATTCNTPYSTCVGQNTANYVNPVYPVCSGIGANAITLMLMDTCQVTLTVTDANGCSTTCSFLVYAEDARCWSGNGNNQKVTICHRSGTTCGTICVDSSAVAAHLAHGDVIGTCRNSSWCFTSHKTDPVGVENTSYLTAYPNPFTGKTTIAFSVPSDGSTVLRVFDAVGKQIGVLFDGIATAGTLYKVEFDGSNYAEGMYFYSIMSNDMNQTKKLQLIK
jgi:hypothetical protein